MCLHKKEFYPLNELRNLQWKTWERLMILWISLLTVLVFSPAYSQNVAKKQSPRSGSPLLSKKEDYQKAFENKNYKKIIDEVAPFANEVENDLLLLLSQSYQAQKDWLNSIRILKIYEDREPDRFRPHFLLGEAYQNNKQFDEAIAHYRKSIELAPQHQPSYQGILNITMELKDHYESRTILAQMIRRFGARPEFLNRQCELYSKGGFLSEAESVCREALNKDRKTPENHIFLAEALMSQERKQAAESVYRNAARQFSQSEFVQFATGEFYFNQKNFPTASRYLAAAVKIKSDSARSQLGLALSLFEEKKYSESLKHFKEACRLDKTRSAFNELRATAAKLNKANVFEWSDAFDKLARTCF